MLLDYKNNIELEGDEEGAIEAKIDKKNLPFVFDLLTRQQYKDPIGSIVREVTSNCFDAHEAAGIEEQVTIDLNTDESGSFISFKDKGNGMSPEIMENVYMSYGESTKRNTKKQIGGFGLGGKSPLAYTDSYFLTTVYDNIVYEYIIYRGVELPTFKLISSEEVCATSSIKKGTLVKIYFVESDDKYSFINKIKEQLSYFSNIFFKQSYLFSNDFQIIEAEHFKFRSDIHQIVQYTSALQYMHITIGPVFYPIDWSKLNRDRIEIPVALKFDINDLIVTPERESLRYIDVNGKSTVSIINEKIDLVLKEFEERYEKQSKIELETINEYLNYKEKDAIIELSGVKFILSNEIKEKYKHLVSCKQFRGLDSQIYSNFKGIFNTTIKIIGYKTYPIKNVKTPDTYLLKYSDFINTKIYYANNILNKTYNDVKKYLISTGSYFYLGQFDINLKILINISGIEDIKLPYNTNKVQQIKLLKNVLLDYARSKSINIDTVVIPRDYLVKIKPKLLKKEEEIVVQFYNELKVSYRKMYINTSSLEKFTGFIIYGFKEDANLLSKWATIFSESKYNTDKDFTKSKAIKIFEVARLNKHHFSNLKNAVYVTNFMGDNRVFKNIATAVLINKESRLTDISINDYILSNSNFEISDKVFKLRKFLKDYGKDSDYISEEFIESIIDIAKLHNLLNEDYVKIHNEVNDYLNGLELLKFVDQNNSGAFQYIIDFIRLKGKAINKILIQPLKYEIDIIFEMIAKMEYKLSIMRKPDRWHSNQNYELLEKKILNLKQITNFYEYTSKTN